jgi:hypothetical protein
MRTCSGSLSVAIKAACVAVMVSISFEERIKRAIRGVETKTLKIFGALAEMSVEAGDCMCLWTVGQPLDVDAYSS